MATSIIPVRAIGVRACAISGNRNPDPNRRKSSSPNWWTPLFGWSSEADYIDSDNAKTEDPFAKPVSVPEAKQSSRSRFVPGSFTEEKARRLRMLMTDTSSFHDVMYHSAIASRMASDFSQLASDISDRSDR